jgi:hypothetical protein
VKFGSKFFEIWFNLFNNNKKTKKSPRKFEKKWYNCRRIGVKTESRGVYPEGSKKMPQDVRIDNIIGRYFEIPNNNITNFSGKLNNIQTQKKRNSQHKNTNCRIKMLSSRLLLLGLDTKPPITLYIYPNDYFNIIMALFLKLERIILN